jgi:DNA polymerase-3 subunit epsilon
VRKCLVFDLETSGVDIKECFVTEIAYLLLDLDTKRTLKMGTHLVKPDEKYELSKELVELTGIDTQMVNDYGKPFNLIIDEIYDLALPPFDDEVQFLVGHNINMFDKPILDRYIDKYSKDKFMPQEYIALKKIPCIDTSSDLPIPSSIKTRKLTHLCYEHNIVMMPAHRAIVDCLMTAQLLFKYDIDKVIELSKEEKSVLRADIGGPWMANFNEKKQLAVGHGFRWNPNLKIWSKTARKSEIEKGFPFPTNIL